MVIEYTVGGELRQESMNEQKQLLLLSLDKKTANGSPWRVFSIIP
jgi:hypothetical protein